MRNVLGFLLIAYLYGLAPLLLGMTADRITQRFCRDKELSRAYVRGYLLYLLGFLAEAIVMIHRGSHLSSLAKLWFLTAAAIGVVSVILNGKQFKKYIKSFCVFLRNGSAYKAAVVIGVILIVLSVVWFVPYPDTTVAYADTANRTDTMYYYDIYTMEYLPQDQLDKRYLPYEMYYAVGANLSGIAPVILIKRIMPIFLLMLFYAAIWQIGKLLFEKNQGKMMFFFYAMLAIAGFPVYADADYSKVAIFTNSWNGPVLFHCVIFPYVLTGIGKLLFEIAGKGYNYVKSRK